MTHHCYYYSFFQYFDIYLNLIDYAIRKFSIDLICLSRTITIANKLLLILLSKNLLIPIADNFKSTP